MAVEATTTRDLIKQVAAGILRRRTVRRAGIHMARAGGRSLVLVYHRLTEEDSPRHEIVPSLPVATFAEQLDVLASIGDIVALPELFESTARGRRPRFAITFDDDHPCHRRHALPLLQRGGVPATFFLSGRALHGQGAYWWVTIEHSIVQLGLEATCRALGVAARTPAGVADALLDSPDRERLVNEKLPAVADAPMGAADIHALANGGMTIGFHTLRHPVLTLLSPPDLDSSLSEGLPELAAAADRPITLFAYPHGRADDRVAAAARQHGFRAAFVTHERAITRVSHPFLLGRWNPGSLTGDDFAAALTMRLLLPPTPRATAVRSGG